MVTRASTDASIWRCTMVVDTNAGEVVGLPKTGTTCIVSDCPVSPESCKREWFSNQNAKANLVPAYWASSYIP